MTLHPSSRMASRSWVANRTARSPRRSFRSAAAFFHGLRVHAGEGFVQQQSVAPGPEERGAGPHGASARRKASGQAGQAPAHHIQIVENPTRFAFCIVFSPPEAPVPRSARRSAAGRADPPEEDSADPARPAPCPNPALPAPSGCGAGWSCPSRWLPRERQAPQGVRSRSSKSVFLQSVLLIRKFPVC